MLTIAIARYVKRLSRQILTQHQPLVVDAAGAVGLDTISFDPSIGSSITLSQALPLSVSDDLAVQGPAQAS